MGSNLANQYAGYFHAFQEAIQNLVNLITAFTKTIQKFVEGFKKTITTNEEFKDSDI